MGSRNSALNALLEEIALISDKEYQRRIWIRGEGPECDDFDETVCRYYDVIDRILEKKAEFGLSDIQYQILKKFHYEFEIFCEGPAIEYYLPQLFIDIPEWTNITKIAKEVLDVFCDKIEYEKIKGYVVSSMNLLKELIEKEGKTECQQKKDCYKFERGMATGYFLIINILKNNAFLFCIDKKTLGLADIKPNVDLVDLQKTHDMAFRENNWSKDIMNEYKVKAFLCDSVKLLRHQASEAKKEANSPNVGFEDYNRGLVMAYDSVFSVLKNQASIFNIDQEEIGLIDIESERDFL